MNQNTPLHKKKEFISRPLKYVITIASLAGTLGLWGIFSKVDAQTQNVKSTDPVIPTVATLVSFDTVPASNQAVDSALADTSSVNALPVVTQPAPSTVNSAPQTVFNQPVPVTSTSSSRP
ncbi:MAG: hypothetical protein AB9897_06220 [Anaerolineaceae bacterium]